MSEESKSSVPSILKPSLDNFLLLEEKTDSLHVLPRFVFVITLLLFTLVWSDCPWNQMNHLSQRVRYSSTETGYSHPLILTDKQIADKVEAIARFQ